jgi:hypothetical protein
MAPPQKRFDVSTDRGDMRWLAAIRTKPAVASMAMSRAGFVLVCDQQYEQVFSESREPG